MNTSNPLDAVEQLVQRQLDPLAGPGATLWDSDGIAEAWDESEPLLRATQPPWVQLHTWEPHRVASEIRGAIPGVRLVVGVGVDGVARRVALGQWSERRGVLALGELAAKASDIGAEAITWNAEAGWKRPPSSDEARRLAEVIRTTLAEVAARHPHLRQWHTSYDHPTYHSAYPWRAWLGVGSPIEASFPQVYAAPGGGLSAHRGALPRREAAALASWDRAIRAGWITADDPSTPVREGVRWAPYYQMHHVDAVDTVRSALGRDQVALWALSSRSDDAGREAFRVLCAAWRAGLWNVRALQAAVGVEADGSYGPRTHAAAVAWAAR